MKKKIGKKIDCRLQAASGDAWGKNKGSLKENKNKLIQAPFQEEDAIPAAPVAGVQV
jgi:hypothetical protein